MDRIILVAVKKLRTDDILDMTSKFWNWIEKSVKNCNENNKTYHSRILHVRISVI